MKFLSSEKPVSYLETHAAQIVKDIRDSRQPLLITENGEAKVVLMDARSYDEQQETMALLTVLAMGNGEIENGKFRPAEDVFADLDEDDCCEISGGLSRIGGGRSQGPEGLYCQKTR